MEIVIIEPLGITDDALTTLALLLRADGHKVIAYDHRENDKKKLVERVVNADVIMLANQPLDGEVIGQCKNLKLIDIAFTGVDHVDLQACRERGITVCNAAGYATDAVAEIVFGMIIDLLRYVFTVQEEVRNGGTMAGLVGRELSGKRLGIIGTGAIGNRVAAIARAFGCEVLAYSRSQSQEALALGVQYMPLDQLLSESDIVTVHVPLTDETQHLLNTGSFKKMKKTAILINTARAAVVDSFALTQALINGEIAGAAVDVYEMEPPLPEDYPLLSAPNTLLTPHVAFATKESLYKRAAIVFDNVRHWLEGEPKNIVV